MKEYVLVFVGGFSLLIMTTYYYVGRFIVWKWINIINKQIDIISYTLYQKENNLYCPLTDTQ